MTKCSNERRSITVEVSDRNRAPVQETLACSVRRVARPTQIGEFIGLELARGSRLRHSMSLLEINNLKLDFGSDRQTVRVVDDLSLSIEPAETVCLVGESGSGKSVTALSIAVKCDRLGLG